MKQGWQPRPKNARPRESESTRRCKAHAHVATRTRNLGFGPGRRPAPHAPQRPSRSARAVVLRSRSGTADSATQSADSAPAVRPPNATRSVTDASDASLNDPVPAGPKLGNTGRCREPKPRPRRGLETKRRASGQPSSPFLRRGPIRSQPGRQACLG